MPVAAPPASDSLVSQPQREVMYAARREGLTLVHTPEYPILGGSGQKTGQVTEGVRIEFRDGVLRIPLEGEVTTAQGRRFPAPDLIEWLDTHRLNGDQHEGFFLVAQAAPPVSDEEMDAITQAATMHDVERLALIRDQELSGWKRSQVTRAASQAIETIERVQAEIREQLEAEREAEAEPETTRRSSKRAPRQ